MIRRPWPLALLPLAHLGLRVPQRCTSGTEPPGQARGVGPAVPRLADPPGEERLPLQRR